MGQDRAFVRLSFLEPSCAWRFVSDDEISCSVHITRFSKSEFVCFVAEHLFRGRVEPCWEECRPVVSRFSGWLSRVDFPPEDRCRES